MGASLQLGPVLTGLITAGVIAGAVATSGVVVLAWRADAADKRVEAIDERQRAVVTNQAVLVREMEWTSRKLDKLLTSNGLQIPPPPPYPE